ncbi:MAG: hypothetical protein EDM05_009485 [Leptolyngbya sp. IPPAS B-1204]|nr:hypothetical protein [Elainella sp. C42_A2020_010]RNJ66482.1 MAG: hypothetical protein EDM05_25385 [Leptolyngbya sp. IPPAS B-1204]
MFKQVGVWTGITAAVIGVALAPQGYAQINEQEFQMGRAREACRNQAEQQRLTVNQVVSTMPISGSGGQMIGSDVILNVSRGGNTYDVRCTYDNASRSATIANLPDPNGSGNSTTVPTEGSFEGRGLASGSVFGNERETDAMLSFNSTNNFSFSLAVPPGTGAQVNYSGRIRSTRSTGANSFVLRGQVQRFASSANNLEVINATGTCEIEVFDARVISSTCNTRARDSATRFAGLKQF